MTYLDKSREELISDLEEIKNEYEPFQKEIEEIENIIFEKEEEIFQLKEESRGIRIKLYDVKCALGIIVSENQMKLF